LWGGKGSREGKEKTETKTNRGVFNQFDQLWGQKLQRGGGDAVHLRPEGGGKREGDEQHTGGWTKSENRRPVKEITGERKRSRKNQWIRKGGRPFANQGDKPKKR